MIKLYLSPLRRCARCGQRDHDKSVFIAPDWCWRANVWFSANRV